MRGWIVVLIAGALAAVLGFALVGDGTEPSPRGSTSDTPASDRRQPPELQGAAEDAGTPERAAPASARPVAAFGPDAPWARGLVVDSRRRPVEGAEIVVTIEGQETDRTTTDAEGLYRVRFGSHEARVRHGLMRVRKGDRGADQHVYLSAYRRGGFAYEPIVLETLRELVIAVEHAGAPRAGARVVVMDARRGATAEPVAEGTTDASGRLPLAGVPGAVLRVHAHAAGFGRGMAQVAGGAQGTVTVELPPDRTITVKVLDAGSQSPVEGATVWVSGAGALPFPSGPGCLPALPPLTTGSDGTVQVSGLPAGYLIVAARAEDRYMRNAGMRAERSTVTPDGTEATVLLYPARTVRFPLADDSKPVADGTMLALTRYQPLTGYDLATTVAAIEDGQLVLHQFPPGHDWGHVVTLEGLWAKWQVPFDKDVGAPVTFRPAHDIRMKLTWSDGTPATGQHLSAILAPRGRGGPVVTDAEGVAVFPRCIAERAHVLWTPVPGVHGRSIADLTLETDPGTVECTIERPVTVELAVRVKGQPRIPHGYRITIQNPHADPLSPRKEQVTKAQVDEDPGRGLLRFVWLPFAANRVMPVTLAVEGMPDVTAEPMRGTDGIWRAAFDMQESSTLVVAVTKPESGRYMLMVERWLEDAGSWRALFDSPVWRAGRRGVDGVHTFKGFAPGRYRVQDRRSGIASAPFDLLDGGESLHVALDLGAAMQFTGRVEVPSGECADFATVRVAGREHGAVSRANPVPLKPDGTWQFAAVRGERLQLLVEHPLLKAPEIPPAFVVGGEPAVVRLRKGPEVVFTIAGSDETTRDPAPNASPSWHSSVRVRVERAEDLATVKYGRMAVGTKGRFRLGVKAPGIYSVQIEMPGRLPWIRDGVEIGTGATDLGTITLSAGTVLTARLFRGEKPLPQRLAIVATRVGGRPHETTGHQLKQGDPPTIEVKALGAGTYRVEAKRMFGLGAQDPLFTTEVESDGRTPVTVDIRLP